MLSNLWQRTVRFRAFLLFLLSLLAILVGLIGIWLLMGILSLVVTMWPPKGWQHRNAAEREELKSWVQNTCRLAPFPATANDLEIQYQGSFTRRYRVTFSDTPATIRNWLASCPGYVESEDKTPWESSLVIQKNSESTRDIRGSISLSTDEKRVEIKITDT
jgi:hypothetical protein